MGDGEATLLGVIAAVVLLASAVRAADYLVEKSRRQLIERIADLEARVTKMEGGPRD